MKLEDKLNSEALTVNGIPLVVYANSIGDEKKIERLRMEIDKSSEFKSNIASCGRYLQDSSLGKDVEFFCYDGKYDGRNLEVIFGVGKEGENSGREIFPIVSFDLSDREKERLATRNFDLFSDYAMSLVGPAGVLGAISYVSSNNVFIGLVGGGIGAALGISSFQNKLEAKRNYLADLKKHLEKNSRALTLTGENSMDFLKNCYNLDF